jgi:adenosylhomocysteine nucleosidase
MRILVTFAVDAEFAPWRSRHPFVPYDFDDSGRKRDFDLFKANISSAEVTVLLTGMGRVSATSSLASITLEPFDLCISTGLAGALDPSLKLKEIVACRAAGTLDRSLKALTDPKLFILATSCGAKPIERFLTSEVIVATVDHKSTLQPSASVVEMETAHVMDAMTKAGVPSVGIRAISDIAQEDLPVDFSQVTDARGYLKFGPLLRELAIHPHKLPLLVRFGSQSRSAAQSLADFLDAFVPIVVSKFSNVRPIIKEEVPAT